MRAEVVEKLLELNQAFYDGQAASFAASRKQPQPGFEKILACLPQPCRALLDVGCGEGRFGRFVQTHQPVHRYVGVDFSTELLAIAHSQVCSADFSRPSATAEIATINFYQRDMTQPDFLAGLGRFNVVVCLAALHHVPGKQNRVRLVREMAGSLAENGRLILSTWQFMNSERQRRKVRDWSEIGVYAADVEANDYLLSWQRGGFSYRYACMIDETETAELARVCDLEILCQFRSDGKEGNLSLYTVLGKQEQ